jgi:cell division protein FtsZ
MIPNIKVLGVGGGGCNAVNRMVAKKVEGFEFIALNTDEKSLEKNLANTKIVMGRNCCSRKGAKGNPKFGQMAANESKDEIATALRGADVVLIVAGLGGGTGTGATPEVVR